MSSYFHRASAGPPMEFEFVTDASSVMQILKLWNIRLLESIPPSQPQFNTTPTFTSKHNSSKERRSFRTPKAAPIVQDNDLKRAGSFSKMHTLGTGQLVNGAALPGRRSWGGSNELYPPPVPSGSQLSQESVFNSLTSPPPLPPRPEESDSDDPDYSYIDENKVKGPGNQHGGRSRTLSATGTGGRVSSPTLDDQLEELKKSILRENKKKKRDKAAHQGRKAATLHFPPRSNPRSRLPMNFVRAEPEDYLEPVASKRLTSTSSEGVPRRDKLSPNIDNLPRSLSDHAGNENNSSSSSIGTAPGEVFDNSQSPPDIHAHHHGSTSNVSVGTGGAVGTGGIPPALPPRSWRNGSITSVSSISSVTSPSSASVVPLTNPPSNSRTSISEERPIIEEEKRSPTLQSPKEMRQASHVEQVSQMAAAASMSGGNGRPVGLKDGSNSPIDQGSSSVSPPPPLPPRSPTRDRERLSRKSSSSSVSSNASSSHRCPRCRSLKKTKPLVGKTASLDPRGGIQGPIQNLTKEENRKSLPDLNNTSPFPENNLAQNRQHHGHSVSREHNHGHSCSKCSVGSSTDGFPAGPANSNGSLPASSSSQNFEYLQLLSEEGERRAQQQQQQQQQTDIDTDVSPALDLLSSCLQDLEYLENKVNQQSNNSPPNSGSPNQLKNSNKSAAAVASEQRRMAVQTDIDAAMRQTELVQADLDMTRRNVRPVNSVGPEETWKMVANGHPPLLKKHNTVHSFGSHSLSSSPSPPGSSASGNGSSGGPLHWTQQPHPPQASNRPTNLANGSMTRNSSSSSLVSNPANIASPLSVQSPNPVFSPITNAPPTIAATVGGAMGVAMSGAPPVPPRSLVSLGGEAQQPQHHMRGHVQSHGHHMMGRSFSQTTTRPHTQQRGLSKSNSLGRHVGTWKTAIYGDPHHGPQRSSSAAGMAPGMVGVGGPPPAAFHNQNHIDSQTVFVHHLSRSGTRHGSSRQMQAHLV